jgi:uncharacterized protein
MTMTRIVHLHGDGATHWAHPWVAHVQARLIDAGIGTFFETFPDSIDARAEYWLPFLRDHVRAGADDVLLGWSAGAVAAMRYAQEHRVRGLVLVAPYYTDLGLEVVRRSGFVTSPWDWPAIRANATDRVLFHSEGDPYIAQAEFRSLAELLQAEVHVLEGAGHFADLSTFDELEDFLLQRYRA